MLYTPNKNGAQHYCGPFSVATITGESFEAIYKRFRSYRSRHGRAIRDRVGKLIPIRGTWTREVLGVLDRLGYRHVRMEFKDHKRPTLGQVCDDLKYMTDPILLNVTGHFIVLKHGWLCDTYTGEPIEWQKYRRLKIKVLQVLVIKKKKGANRDEPVSALSSGTMHPL